ncbi:MAG: hypothetical protein CVU05_05025 [Bacteroidetes bacterium HGW-Bacteroidetes-21]|jgi:flagellar hook assembly protein FlgD|nr:MAG: hypothetical protein CVU05_05025 [Bacteroidetes bacterium HGW-Bacteroidetes-21]
MKYLFTLIIVSLSLMLSAQTMGTLSFSVKTVAYSASYSPRHILAIWIADGNGQWVKTRKRMYQNTVYRQYLTNFKNATSNTYNATDATTGATLQSHASHTVTWDGKDASGNLVADGTYRVYVEFTSANATGKLYYCEFTKGPNAQNLTPSNVTNFNDISLSWTPIPSSVSVVNKNVSENISCYPNPFNESINIAIAQNESNTVKIDIYDICGKLAKTMSVSAIPENTLLTWDGSYENGKEANPGIYYITVHTGNQKRTVKVVKQ